MQRRVKSESTGSTMLVSRTTDDHTYQWKVGLNNLRSE